MFIYATQPQSPGKVIADSFQLYKSSFSKIWYWQLLFFVVLLLVSGFIVLFIWFASMLGTGFVFILQLINYFIWMLATAFMLFKIHAIATQSHVTSGQAIRVGLIKFFPLTCGRILFSIAIGIIFLLMTIPIHLIGLSKDASGLLFIFIEVPIIIFLALPMVFFAPSMVLDNLKLFSAFKYSPEYSR